MTNCDPFGFAQERFNICYFGAARDNYEVRNEDYGFCSIYGEAFDATGVGLGEDVKKVAAPYIHLTEIFDRITGWKTDDKKSRRKVKDL